MTFNADPSTWTVLVIEDDPDNQDLVRLIFRYNRAAVHCAYNGKQGLEVLDRLMPSLVLMDLSMPMMDGWMMLTQIRSRPKTATVPVIALTAHAMEGDKERVLASGFDGYIAKPFQVATFLDQIKSWLNKAAARKRLENWINTQLEKEQE